MTEPTPPRVPPEDVWPKYARHAIDYNRVKAKQALGGDDGARDFLSAKMAQSLWNPGEDFDGIYEWAKGMIDEQLEANREAITEGEDIWEGRATVET